MLVLCWVLYQDSYRELEIRLGAYSSLAVFLGKHVHHCSKPCFVRSGGFWHLQKCPIWCQGNTGLGTFLNTLLRWILHKVNLEKPYWCMLNAWVLLMLPNLSKQVHTFLTSLPVLWQDKSPARYVWNVWNAPSICKKKRYRKCLIILWRLPD